MRGFFVSGRIFFVQLEGNWVRHWVIFA